MKDYYKILGVSESASQSDVKKAYRELAKKYHPDKCQGDPAAEEKFKDAAEAYRVLSNEKEKKQYDAIRKNPFIRKPGPSSGHDPFVNFNPFNEYHHTQSSRRTHSAFDDLFSQVFGKGFSFQNDPFDQFSAMDQKARVTISFEQALKGSTILLKLQGGKKIRLKLQPGLNDGKILRVKGKGKYNPFTKKHGDLLVKINVLPHPSFRIQGKNIHVSINISLAQAAHGETIQIRNAWGEKVKLKIPANTRSGKVLRLKGLGVKTKNGNGDFLIKVNVKTPSGRARDKKGSPNSETT